MNSFACALRKFEFESRIFISLLIVGILCLVSFVFFKRTESNLVIAGQLLGISETTSLKSGYLVIAFLLAVATLLRMWAGSHLSSDRIMAFKVQHDCLTTTGPFSIVRNPVYLADLIAFSGFALCLNPAGLLLPFLIWLHYRQLIAYEVESLQRQFGQRFSDYKQSTPALLPHPALISKNWQQFRKFRINYDGFRHNAQYMLFIPGFIIAAISGSFIYAVIIGLPAVIDWAVIHTIKGVAAEPAVAEKQKANLAESKVFSDILYAQCWEDPLIDREAFKTGPDDVIFSVTSGGCNVLSFLLDNPKKIISLDLNPAQNYLLDLKIAAFRSLGYNRVLEFFGIYPSKQRWNLYLILRSNLGIESRNFWDNHPEEIRAGIIHCGRFENYMHLLKKWFNRVMGKSLIKDLSETGSISEREILYNKKWDNFRWKLFTGVFLSRPFMSLLFDKAFFRQLEESFSFGRYFRHIIKRAVTRFSLKENPFLGYILTGNYTGKNLPDYLKKENYETIRERLDRIEMMTGDCLDYFRRLPGESVSRFNFTNIFEWMPRENFETILKETIRIARDESVITYRNLLVPRSRPENLAEQIVPDFELAAKLHEKDRSFIYRKYVVEKIRK